VIRTGALSAGSSFCGRWKSMLVLSAFDFPVVNL